MMRIVLFLVTNIAIMAVIAILFSVFGNVLGLISQARLPRLGTPPGYDPAFTGDRFGILASCQAEDENALTDFFATRGAEARKVRPEPLAASR